MKHIKLFESFNEIDSICRKFSITNWTLNEDGTVDVNGDVDITKKELVRLPIKFRKVSGDFYCKWNKLTTLEGGPMEVGGNFYCSGNNLVNLEGSPIYVGGVFDCSANKLSTLKGAPIEVGGAFVCFDNELNSLEFSPIRVGGNFICRCNNLISLEGAPREVGGDFDCAGNPISTVYRLFPNYKSYIDSLDYNYIRGTNIVKSRLKEALEELNRELPRRIFGYKYI